MKRNWKNSKLTWLWLMLLVIACGKTNDHTAQLDAYTCPMHPTVASDKAGTCPVCGMQLVRKVRPGERIEMTDSLTQLTNSPNERVIASMKTIKGEYKSIPLTLTAQGIVTYDTRKAVSLSSRIGGRLEKIFVRYPFQPVKKGEKVAEIYSPELITAQRELLFLQENDPENKTLINDAKERLRLLGASDAQITTLLQRKNPQSTFAIYSPHDGFVFSETQPTPTAPLTKQPAPAGGMNDDMGSSPSQPSVGTSTTAFSSALPAEGTYVVQGQTLFQMVSMNALRIELNIPATTARTVQVGTEAILDFRDGEHHHATVDFIQPFFSEGQEFLTVRAYTHKMDNLHIGHLVIATLTGSPIEALWVPREAVLDLGINKVVFVKDKGVFKPEQVTVGMTNDNATEIKQGLSSSDEIAANAQYLVDSESFIKTEP